jgi:nucleoside 2-deoxyribosyltransferase
MKPSGCKLYLAGPLFTTAEREFNSRLCAKLTEIGFDCWLPQDHEPREKTAKAIFLEDVRGIDWADIVVANMDGPDPDSGTCWEVGYSYAKGKHIICYRTDFRNVADFSGSPYNLMLSQSADRTFEVNALTEGVLAVAECIYHNVYYLPAVTVSQTDAERPYHGERLRHIDK